MSNRWTSSKIKLRYASSPLTSILRKGKGSRSRIGWKKQLICQALTLSWHEKAFGRPRKPSREEEKGETPSEGTFASWPWHRHCLSVRQFSGHFFFFSSSAVKVVGVQPYHPSTLPIVIVISFQLWSPQFLTLSSCCNHNILELRSRCSSPAQRWNDFAFQSSLFVTALFCSICKWCFTVVFFLSTS